jgi:NAD(P)-dependent dehydrogenase (short-subunit alcohol dehydrogenase family)
MKRTVLITGVLGGIGKATATLFRKKGWYVVGVDVRKSKIPSFTNKFLNLDISDTKQVDDLYKEVHKTIERLDSLVNNAAIQITKKITELTENEWDLVFSNNVKPAFYISKVFYPLLKKARGQSLTLVLFML